MTPRIRYGGIIAGHEEIRAVTEVLAGQGWAPGPKTAEFEASVAAWQGRGHALFVNSGSSALLLALSNLPRGSRVAMPALQFPTLYSAAKWCGLVPVLVDIDDSLNMHPRYLRGLAADGVIDAVAFVHMAGNPSNITETHGICQRYGLPLIEDICEAFGAAAEGVHAGNFGLAAAASTHGAHHISTGQGGLVFADDEHAWQRMRRIRDWGRAYGNADIPGYYEHYVFSELGLNLQATDMQAALGVVQLKRANGFIARRRENWTHLASLLQGLPLQVPEVRAGCDPSWFAFPMLVPDAAAREAFMTRLAAEGIESRTIVAGNITRQPAYDGPPEDFPVADKWFRRGVWVSVHPRVSAEDVAYMAKVIRGFWESP